MDRDTIDFFYNKLPKSWLKLSTKNFVISSTKYNSILEKIANIKDKGVVIFSKNIHKVLIKDLSKTKKVYGINFIDYFDSLFKKEDFKIPLTRDVYVIYNVGMEKALNKEFSSQILKGIIEHLKENNKIVIIGTDVNYTDFVKKYNLECINKIQVNEKQEESIIWVCKK